MGQQRRLVGLRRAGDQRAGFGTAVVAKLQPWQAWLGFARCWQHRYKDITSVSPRGRFLLDYTKFHDTVPED
jgi:hypothetical protein